MTIENLAVMIKHGFDGVDKRFDGVDKRIEKVENNQRNMFDEINALHADVRDIKGTLGPLFAW